MTSYGKRQQSALSGALAQGISDATTRSHPTPAQHIADRSAPFAAEPPGPRQGVSSLANDNDAGFFSMAALGSSPIAAPMSYLVRMGGGAASSMVGGAGTYGGAHRRPSGTAQSPTPTHGFLVPAVAREGGGGVGTGGIGAAAAAGSVDISVGSMPIIAGMSPGAESWRTAGSGASLASSLPRRTSGMLPRPVQRPSYVQIQRTSNDGLTAPLLPATSPRDDGQLMAGNYSPAHVPMSPPGAAMARGSSLDTAAQGAEWGGGAVSWPEVSGPGAPTTLQDHFGARDGGNLKAVVFGLINGAVGLPALIAFAAIVFQDPTYTPYLGALCKLFFLSSAVHQFVFCWLSTLPFAIGQVQDVGLIFLSAMASSIAAACEDSGRSGQVALATSLVTLTLSTLVVGLATIAVGKLRGAGLVQYVPLPVVGGYLGYVGYFCIAGGLGLGTSTEISSLLSWRALLCADALAKFVPTLASTAALMLTMEHCSHPLALPAVLTSIPLAFHAVLLAAGWSLADAQAAGWAMLPPEGGRYFWQLVDLFNWQEGWNGIYWGAVLAQLPKLLGLFLVVCFGSCMDVAAIQQDMPTPLDFNRELITVGISNTVVGALGVGYTGSYIFSQTVFTMRAGVFNRLNGVVVAVIELAVFALPFNVVQYCPNFFFGALLLWFGVEICRDWLVLSYAKLSAPEYTLLWLTFGAIMATGLEVGIAAGCVAATLYFAFRYAQSQVQQLAVVAPNSGAHHGHEHAALLEQLVGGRVAALALSGFIFFGSSTSIAARVEEEGDRLLRAISDQLAAARAAVGGAANGSTAVAGGVNGGTGVGAGAPDHTWARRVLALADAPAFVILDFRAVSHLDATGARTFGTLLNSLASRGITVCFSGLGTSPAANATRGLLAAHGVKLQTYKLASGASPTSSRRSSLAAGGVGAGSGGQHSSGSPHSGVDVSGEDMLGEGAVWEFPSLQAAVGYAESAFLGLAVSRRLLPPPPLEVSLGHVLSQHAQSLPLPSGTLAELTAAITPLLHTRTLVRGEQLFAAGQEVEHLMLVEQGVLQLEAPADSTQKHGAQASGLLQTQPQPQHAIRVGSGESAQPVKQTAPLHGPQRSTASSAAGTAGRTASQYGPGCFVAAAEFYLCHPAPATASAASHTCRVVLLSRDDVRHLFVSQPQGAALLHWAAVRATSLELSACREMYEHAPV